MYISHCSRMISCMEIWPSQDMENLKQDLSSLLFTAYCKGTANFSCQICVSEKLKKNVNICVICGYEGTQID